MRSPALILAALLLAGCASGGVSLPDGRTVDKQRACIAAQTALAGVATLTKDDDRRLRIEALWSPLAAAYCV